MTLATCRLTAKNRNQLRNPMLGNRVWATFTFVSQSQAGHVQQHRQHRPLHPSLHHRPYSETPQEGVNTPHRATAAAHLKHCKIITTLLGYSIHSNLYLPVAPKLSSVMASFVSSETYFNWRYIIRWSTTSYNVSERYYASRRRVGSIKRCHDPSVRPSVCPTPSA